MLAQLGVAGLRSATRHSVIKAPLNRIGALVTIVTSAFMTDGRVGRDKVTKPADNRPRMNTKAPSSQKPPASALPGAHRVMPGPGTMRFRNEMALWPRIFALVFLAMVAMFSWLAIRDGSPPGWSSGGMLLVLAAFWLFGLGFAAHAVNQPRVRIDIGDDGQVSVALGRVFRAEHCRYRAAELGPAELVEGSDDEGAPYFHARLRLPGRGSVDFAEGHHRGLCEQAVERFNAALVAAATGAA